jgi:nitrite reductase/ring-hydroxylating ferredoxin subunit
VALGVMQEDRRAFIPLLLGGSFLAVTLLHLAAAWRERETAHAAAGDWIVVGRPEDIPDQAARIVAAPNGERIAVFRDGTQVGALTNVCAHQNGPIGEGRIINGCVTCPWHGYEYRLEDGCAPPPFTEKLATYRVRLRDGLIEVDPQALPPGTKAAIVLPG